MLCFACDNNVDVRQRGLHLLPPSIEWHNTPPEHRQPEQVVRLLPVALFFFFLLFCFVLFCFVCVYVCVFVVGLRGKMQAIRRESGQGKPNKQTCFGKRVGSRTARVCDRSRFLVCSVTNNRWVAVTGHSNLCCRGQRRGQHRFLFFLFLFFFFSSTNPQSTNHKEALLLLLLNQITSHSQTQTQTRAPHTGRQTTGPCLTTILCWM